MNADTDRLLARIARLEAQSDIRGRAVVIYRERAQEAEAERDAARGYISELETAVQSRNDVIRHREAERDEWRQTALDERGAAIDALEQVKVRDARAADIWDEGWAQGMAYVVGMERGIDDDENVSNPYKRNENA